ncbi:hypothetical protein [Vibrio porteresiae]|uniref:Uncharacterized protein n=1 Tax=Vibrio porteresiae DSM 19223 TaxID=1123496 RepID=A0ABZ0QJP8_9VIBR|nr:hypothetical protein [Vibrio porteresiae]WPC75710.1 hypothetical protein R8Z52_22575 [Vibrio porteresiae DSM 19223]
MSDADLLTQWLKEHTKLSWQLTDKPALTASHDSEMLDRNNGVQMRDFILSYYQRCQLPHSPKNYARSLTKIMDFGSDQKVAKQALMDHLVDLLKKEKRAADK